MLYIQKTYFLPVYLYSKLNDTLERVDDNLNAITFVTHKLEDKHMLTKIAPLDKCKTNQKHLIISILFL